MQKILVFCLILGLLFSIGAALPGTKVIIYGNDLTTVQKTRLVKDFSLPETVKPETIKTLNLTNEEEYQLLKGLIPEDKIQNQANNAVYLEKLASGTGLKVETKNMSLVTPHMLANALATSGVADTQLRATAPNLMPGTEVLVGIYKAYEDVTSEKLSAVAKRVAIQELAITSDLGEEIGKEKAAVLVERAKERTLKEQPISATETRAIINQALKEQNLTITEAQTEQLANILLGMKELPIKSEQLQTQLKNFAPDKSEETTSKPGSTLVKFFAYLKSWFTQLFSYVGKIFSWRA